MNYLRNKKYNLFITAFVALFCFTLYHTTDMLEGAGVAALILNWLPLIIGVLTIIVYLIVNAISNKFAWVITLLGNLLNLVILISGLINN